MADQARVNLLVFGVCVAVILWLAVRVWREDDGGDIQTAWKQRREGMARSCWDAPAPDGMDRATLWADALALTGERSLRVERINNQTYVLLHDTTVMRCVAALRAYADKRDGGEW
jgi:hypothetical protein